MGDPDYQKASVSMTVYPTVYPLLSTYYVHPLAGSLLSSLSIPSLSGHTDWSLLTLEETELQREGKEVGELRPEQRK